MEYARSFLEYLDETARSGGDVRTLLLFFKSCQDLSTARAQRLISLLRHREPPNIEPYANLVRQAARTVIQQDPKAINVPIIALASEHLDDKAILDFLSQIK